jgi:hypothetical protein
MKVDLTKLTVQELKNLISNNQRLGQVTKVNEAVKEMARRGMATRREYRALKWNQDSVRDAMQPFKDVAAAVNGNQRTAYTEAGGRKIGHPKDDPDWVWIDTYSAIKTPAINAVFVCHIKQPGDGPEFQLRINGIHHRSYNADQLTDALSEWRSTAARATR